jgi:hypothetical protein
MKWPIIFRSLQVEIEQPIYGAANPSDVVSSKPFRYLLLGGCGEIAEISIYHFSIHGKGR